MSSKNNRTSNRSYKNIGKKSILRAKTSTVLMNRETWRPFAHVAIDHSQRFNSEKPLGTDCCEWL